MIDAYSYHRPFLGSQKSIWQTAPVCLPSCLPRQLHIWAPGRWQSQSRSVTCFARSARKDATIPRSKLNFQILVPYPVSNPRWGTAVSIRMYKDAAESPLALLCLKDELGCSCKAGFAMKNSGYLAASIFICPWIPNFMFLLVHLW